MAEKRSSTKRGGRVPIPEAGIVSIAGLNLQWGARNGESRYTGFLRQLLDDPKLRGSALMVGNLKSRYSINKAAVKLGCKVEYAVDGDKLYARVTGLKTVAAIQTNDAKPVSTAADRVVQDVVGALRASGPLTIKELTQRTKIGAVSIQAVLSPLVQNGHVERDGAINDPTTCYRLTAPASNGRAAGGAR